MAKYNDLTTGQSEACINRMGGWDNFLRFIGGQGKVVFETILTHMWLFSCPAQPAVSTSKKYFEDAGVKWTGSNFESQFYGLEVPASKQTEFAIRKLGEASLDAPILAELGDKAEISVSQFRAFLAENRKSTEWFIFYLRGKDGNLWAVDAHWNSGFDGWDVDADSVESLVRWLAGDRVVSRN